jgi:hypothetical protein
VLRPHEERLAKAQRYEHARPGLRTGGRAFNYAFYVPELRGSPPLAAVPGDERAHVEAVLRAGARPGPRRASVEEVSRQEIDRFWPVTSPEAQAGTVEVPAAPERLFAGESRTVDVLVRNEGSAAWPWGRDGVPEVRVGARWLDGAGRELTALEIHTALPAPLAPGEEQLVPAHVRAPDEPGRYRLVLDLVQQHVRRFDQPVVRDVVVAPQPRLAVVGDDEAVARVAAVLAELPELELLRLRRTPSTAPGGYPEAPDARAYLFDDAPTGHLAFAAVLLWRGLRLRVGPTPRRARELVAALRRCDALVVAGPDGPDQRRERWAVRVLERVARRLGLSVAETRDPAEIASLLRRRA